MLAYTYPLLSIFWTLLELAVFVLWIWLLISIFADIFLSHDLSGLEKALWVIFLVVLPILGVLVYLIARGGTMHERAEARANASRSSSTPTSAKPLRRVRRTRSPSSPLYETAGRSPTRSTNA